MSKLETNTIDTVSGTSNLTIGGANNTGSTTIKTNNTDAVTIDSSQNLQFNSGYGSVATAYACRAWVNFNGTGTVAIRGSGNVSSITDNGSGDYTINFTTDMPDVNYSIVAMGGRSSTLKDQGYVLHHSLQVGNFTLETTNTAASLVDYQQPTVAVFR